MCPNNKKAVNRILATIYTEMSSQDIGSFTCKACGMTFSSREELDRHNLEKH